MLSPSELDSLNTIISDDNKTFEVIASNFQKTFSKFDQFKCGMALWYLIKENLINLTQRLSTFYLLYDMYKQEQIPTTPFVPLLLESLDQTKLPIEQKFLSELLDFNFMSQKMTIKQYIEQNKNLQNVKIADIEQKYKIHNTTKDKCSKEINDWIRPVIYDNNTSNLNNSNNNGNNNGNNIINNKSPDNMCLFDLNQLSPEEISYDYFEPSFMTYYPNSNYPFYEDEPMWILPTLKYDFIWDFTMSPEEETISNLINRPLKNQSLTEEQVNFLIETIGENPNILKEINFTPETYMKLIEKNDELATEILIKISNHNTFEEYLSLFLEKNWTVKSMKVICKIIQKIELPNAFIMKYLQHIINNFKNEENKESKNRLAKLISFSILNLLEYEHISIDMIPDDIDKIFEEKIKDDDIFKLQSKMEQLKKANINNLNNISGNSNNSNQ